MKQSFDIFYKKINAVEGEKIVAVIRQHSFAKAHLILIGTLLLVVPFFFMFTIFSWGTVGVTLFVSLITIALIFIFREYYIWSRNVFILTNKKIVDLDQKGLFNKVVSEVEYEKVLDVAYMSKGIVNSIFGLGDIMIKTSIPDLVLIIRYVGNVKLVAAHIKELVQEGGGMNEDSDAPTLSSAQKIENFEDFLGQEELDAYDNYSLKELIEEYTEIYSVKRLKRLLAQELEKDSEDEDE